MKYLICVTFAALALNVYARASGGEKITPENNPFWSINRYGKDGFTKPDNNIVNDRSVKRNNDGTFDVLFGSKENCGDKPKRLDISEGWNFVIRAYRPRPGILKREYKLPEVSAVE